jgi:transmembrane sensor
MSETRAQLLKIIQRYLAGNATADERRFLEFYYDFLEQEENVLDQLLMDEKMLLEEEMQFRILAAGEPVPAGSRPDRKGRVRHLWPVPHKISAAAAILILCVAGCYLVFHQEDRPPVVTQSPIPPDIPPGSNKAILTLADGRKINLDDAKSGELAKQAGISISKSATGELVYTITKSRNSDAGSAINKIETPKGGQYQVILPDGTHVWLNAASSLTYPTPFSGMERRVSLKGEGYFEVTRDAKRPFKVDVDGQTEVKVLGTNFNINAYPEEKTMNTTLLEGAVLLQSNALSSMLVPGQQGQVARNGDPIVLVNQADIDQVIAWKNGFFSAHSASLEMIMRQVERWYDVNVVFKEEVQAEFVAKLPRDLPLSKLLTLLELTKQVHFKVEGKTIEVMK